MLPGPRGVCDATFVRHEGGTGPHRSEHDCQRSKTTKNDRILSNFTQTGRDPVPKGRLKIAQDEILGTRESRREVPKGTAEQMSHHHVGCLVHAVFATPPLCGMMAGLLRTAARA